MTIDTYKTPMVPRIEPISKSSSVGDNIKDDTVTLSEDLHVKIALRLLRDAHNEFSVVSGYRQNTHLTEKEKIQLKKYLKELGELADKI